MEMAFRRGCQLRSNNVNMNVIEEEYHQSYNSLSIVTDLHLCFKHNDIEIDNRIQEGYVIQNLSRFIY